LKRTSFRCRGVAQGGPGPAETISESVRLGLLAALMVKPGYPGEIAINHSARWLFSGPSAVNREPAGRGA